MIEPLDERYIHADVELGLEGRAELNQKLFPLHKPERGLLKQRAIHPSLFLLLEPRIHIIIHILGVFMRLLSFCLEHVRQEVFLS